MHTSPKSLQKLNIEKQIPPKVDSKRIQYDPT